jgi:ornithine cyclodeaminase
LLHITDDMVDAALTPADAQEVLLDAFRSFGGGAAAMQDRVRTEAGGIKLSTLGAVIPGQGFAGAKVYTTLAGQFAFVIILFSTGDGRPIAILDANAITRLRTAACTVIAARYLARSAAKQLALLGAGVQGRAHAIQLATAFPLKNILVTTIDPPPDLVTRMEAETGASVRLCPAEEAVADADMVVATSRATQPLFTGEALKPGVFVAGVGSTLPYVRELDDATLRRASLIAVEWRQQSLREAGDLALAGPGVLSPEKIVELGELVTGKAAGRRDENEITVYKSVGVGLEDIAVAGLAYRRIAAG